MLVRFLFAVNTTFPINSELTPVLPNKLKHMMECDWDEGSSPDSFVFFRLHSRKEVDSGGKFQLGFVNENKLDVDPSLKR